MAFKMAYGDREAEYWFNGSTAILGHYSGCNCGGIDGGGFSGEELLKFIRWVIITVHPHFIIFEDVLFGGLYNFKIALRDLSWEIGYEYIVLELYCDPVIAIKRVYQRNGGMNRKYEKVIDRARSVRRSNLRFSEAGGNVIYLNSANMSSDVLKMVREVIYG